MVLEAARQQHVRHLLGAGLGEDQKTVLGHGSVERRAFFLPVREEFGNRARIHDRAREDMGADFGAFLDQADRNLLAGFVGQLLDADRRGQPGRATANDEDVELHRFALHVLSPDFLLCFGLQTIR